MWEGVQGRGGKGERVGCVGGERMWEEGWGGGGEQGRGGEGQVGGGCAGVRVGCVGGERMWEEGWGGGGGGGG